MARPDDLELARAAWGAFNARDAEALVALCAPDVEVGTLLTAADGETRRGHEGVRDLFAQQDEAFSHLHGEIGEPERHHDWLVLEGRMVGRGRASGVEVAIDFAQAARIEDGLVKAWHFFRSREEAEAAIDALDQVSSGPAGGDRRPPE